MQVIKITSAAFLTESVSCEQVCQIALALGLSQDYINQMLSTPLKKGNKQILNLSCAKLRTIVMQKLGQPNDLVSNWNDAGASFDFEFTGPNFPDETPEPDINAAGQNKRGTGAPRKSGLSGAYVVVKQGLKCSQEQDPEKYALWQFVWSSGTFEQYFANAPKKAVTKTGRIITAASEMAWAIKSGWVKPVAA